MPAGCTSDGRPGFFNVVSTCTFVALPPHDPAVLEGAWRRQVLAEFVRNRAQVTQNRAPPGAVNFRSIGYSSASVPEV